MADAVGYRAKDRSLDELMDDFDRGLPHRGGRIPSVLRGIRVAGATGLEPATSGVTGRESRLSSVVVVGRIVS